MFLINVLQSHDKLATCNKEVSVKRSSDAQFVGSYSTHHCETREEAKAPPEQEWNQETWSTCLALQKTSGSSPNLPVLLSSTYKTEQLLQYLSGVCCEEKTL